MAGLTRRELARRGAAGAAALSFPGWAVEAIAQAPLRQLRRAVRGPVRTPGNSSGLLYNERYDGIKPLAVLLAADAGDVQAAVRWAARNDVPITARSGGHGYAGYASARGGLVVDLRRLDRISVGSGRATIGPGAQLVDVYRKLAGAGATIPAGSCPSVGIGGHALGGGMGLAGRDLGLTLDSIRALRVVTPDGGGLVVLLPLPGRHGGRGPRRLAGVGPARGPADDVRALPLRRRRERRRSVA